MRPRAPLGDLFLSKTHINTETGCWDWTAAKSADGYGRFGISYYRGGSILAHRVAYEMFRSEIPIGRQIDHLCRNRACVNPWHMETVTQRENIHRGQGLAALQARQVSCLRGHPLSGNNLKARKRRVRDCRACGRLHSAYRRMEGVLIRAQQPAS